MNLLEELNESQRLAVEYCEGPSLVIAGAGSGKTRVLTYKIAYLLEQGMKPWNILALTFTNKAAREMKERIGRLVGEDNAHHLYMGTFHSIFSRILRVEAEKLGYTSNFTIYDEADARSLVKSIIKELKLDDKVYKPATVHNRISMAKNHLILADDYGKHRELIERDISQKMPAISQIFGIYQSRCKQANAMDFDDLLTLTYQLFREHEDIRKKYAERFKFVLVDEYQDTNSVQQLIVFQLTKEHQHVCVVGDDAQSIYAFRGANIDNILDFQKMFMGTKLFKLEQNYRSTQLIVQAANSLIKKNERQIPKDVYSRNDKGERIILKDAYSDREEASIVCNEIKRLIQKEGCRYNDFAILYRTNAQSRAFEDEMLKMNIPYRVYGGLSFYQRKEIKDVIAYFRLVVNHDDEEAFKRIINYPARGIGDTTAGKIAATATAHGVSLWAVMCNPQLFSLNVNKGTLSKLNAFRELIEGFIARFNETDAYQLGTDIIKESGIYKDLYSDTEPESVSRQENLEEFLAGLQDFVEIRREEGRENETSLRDYLQEVSLMTDLDSDGNDKETRKVSLMTVHSAKGLEFPTVFVVGLEENIFPSPLSTNSLRELEEERRLLYVYGIRLAQPFPARHRRFADNYRFSFNRKGWKKQRLWRKPALAEFQPCGNSVQGRPQDKNRRSQGRTAPRPILTRIQKPYRERHPQKGSPRCAKTIIWQHALGFSPCDRRRQDRARAFRHRHRHQTGRHRREPEGHRGVQQLRHQTATAEIRPLQSYYVINRSVSTSRHNVITPKRKNLKPHSI